MHPRLILDGELRANAFAVKPCTVAWKIDFIFCFGLLSSLIFENVCIHLPLYYEQEASEMLKFDMLSCFYFNRPKRLIC